MATVYRPGHRITVLPDPRPRADRHWVAALGDQAGCDVTPHGEWVGVRLEFCVRDIDIDRADPRSAAMSPHAQGGQTAAAGMLWVPFADALCWFDRKTGRFHVRGGPNPRQAGLYLRTLSEDETRRLGRDLKFSDGRPWASRGAFGWKARPKEPSAKEPSA